MQACRLKLQHTSLRSPIVTWLRDHLPLCIRTAIREVQNGVHMNALERLPDELWVKILLEVEGEVTDGLCCPGVNPHSVATSQSYFYKLRLVCRKVNDIFISQPRLSRGLTLPPAMDGPSFPSFLSWLQRFGTSLQILAAYCSSSCMEAALSKLQPPHIQLVNVFLSGCNDPAVQLVAGLTALTCCELKSWSSSEVLNLSPLMMLQTLQKLQLSRGTFECVGLPPHLTDLALVDVDLAVLDVLPGGNDCVTSVRKLQVLWSHLVGLHPDGLAAFVALEELDCGACLILGASAEKRLSLAQYTRFFMPAGISALTALTRLHLAVASEPEDAALNLAALYTLTSLQHLSVQCEAVSLSFSAGLSRLKCLQRLHLGADAAFNIYAADELHLELDVDWSAMHALHHLTISNWHFTHIGDLSGLTTLHNLRFVRFHNCLPSKHTHTSDSHSISTGLESLALLLRTNCPHVKVHC